MIKKDSRICGHWWETHWPMGVSKVSGQCAPSMFTLRKFEGIGVLFVRALLPSTRRKTWVKVGKHCRASQGRVQGDVDVEAMSTRKHSTRFRGPILGLASPWVLLSFCSLLSSSDLQTRCNNNSAILVSISMGVSQLRLLTFAFVLAEHEESRNIGTGRTSHYQLPTAKRARLYRNSEYVPELGTIWNAYRTMRRWR